MNFVLGVIIKTTILLAAASLMTLGLRRASASARHTLWSVALLAALLLPLASRLVPQLPLPVLPEESFSTSISLAPVGKTHTSEATPRPLPLQSNASAPVPASPAPQDSAAVDTWSVFSLWTGRGLLLLWSAGAAIVILRLLIGSLTIRRLRRHSAPVEETDWRDILDDLKATFSLRRPIRLRISHQTIPPMTWGMFRPVVLLPATATDWTPSRRRLVLAHELAHIQRNDGIVQILLQAVCSLYWFNPLVWHAARRLRIERECACDDQVLKLGADPDDYADHLLQVARTLSPGAGLSLATVAMAHRSQLETRLLSILDTRTRRQTVSRLASALVFSTVVTLTLVVAAIQVTARPSSHLLDLDAWAPGIPADFWTQTDPQAPVTVHGSIMELRTEKPISGALLTLTPTESEEGVPFEAETHFDGTFSITDVPPGQYHLSLSRDGYVVTHSSSEPARLTVFNGQAPETLQLHMMQGPAISGRVFDTTGKARPSAHVELMRMDFRDGQNTLLASDISMVTDSNGEYRLSGLLPGEYFLRVRPRAGGDDFLPVYFPGVTDPRYATPITVREGADISGVDLSLTRGNLHSVRLKVEFPDPAPANPELSFYITPERSTGTTAAGAVQFHSSGRNTYVSPLLAPGSYDIEVYLRDPDPIRWARTKVDIENRDVDAGTLTIGPGVWIQGRVTAAEALPVGVRRGQLLVILRPLDGSIFLLPSAQVANDGSFMIPRVPERRFRVDLAGLPPEVYFASAKFGGREVINNGFTVSGDNKNALELSISSSGGVVAGVVRGTKDEPIANGTVVLIPNGKNDPNLYRTAATDRFGVFSIAGVPPGEYGVLAWTDGRGKAYLDPVLLKAVENEATKVVVQRGFTNTINVRAITP
jgi:beta-lactamase regulating signal transducer with metallopeptidase domain